MVSVLSLSISLLLSLSLSLSLSLLSLLSLSCVCYVVIVHVPAAVTRVTVNILGVVLDLGGQIRVLEKRIAKEGGGLVRGRMTNANVINVATLGMHSLTLVRCLTGHP